MKALFFVLFPFMLCGQNADFDRKDFNCEDFYTEGCMVEQVKKVRLYPSPTRDILTYEGGNTEGAIYDIKGQYIRRVDLTKEIDVLDLSQGLYILKTNENILKFVKL